jgi:hypothetical protein
LRWSDIDLVTKTVVVNATIKTETVKGTYRKAIATVRVIELTDLAVKVLSVAKTPPRRTGLTR